MLNQQSTQGVRIFILSFVTIRSVLQEIFFFSENIRASFYFSLCQHPSQSIRSIRNFMLSVPKFGKNTRNFFSVNFFVFLGGLGLDSARGSPCLQYLSRKIPTWMKYTLFLFSDFNESQLIYAYKRDAY